MLSVHWWYCDDAIFIVTCSVGWEFQRLVVGCRECQLFCGTLFRRWCRAYLSIERLCSHVGVVIDLLVTLRALYLEFAL